MTYYKPLLDLCPKSPLQVFRRGPVIINLNQQAEEACSYKLTDMCPWDVEWKVAIGIRFAMLRELDARQILTEIPN